MVELPGSLERSTLGDVLGALYRDRVTGTLRLHEISGGREYEHGIIWREGLIHHVETTRRVGAPIGGARRQAAVHWTPDDAQRTGLLERLEALFQVTHARLSFRVMGPRPPSAPLPLGPRDFLHGRRRTRDVENASSRPSPPPPPPESPRARALRTLGLAGEPGVDVVRATFRQLARKWHPDRHPGANEHTRAALCQRFAQITGAYEQLISQAR